MKYLPRYLAALCVALWVGGMWMLGYVVVPELFQILPDRQLAGVVAGRLFTLLAYVGMACGLYLLVYQLRQFGREAFRHTMFMITATMLLLVLIGQFVLQPILVDLKAQALPLDVMKSALAYKFRTWHAISGILYLIQSLLGIVLVLDSRNL
jgi:hypothetical protein